MSLAYDRIGEGPALVLLHPLGADRRVWDPVLPGLAAEHEVIAVDLPGFGGSAPLSHEPTPHALSLAVAALLTDLGIGRPHVAGNSLGGWVALELGAGGEAKSVTAIAPAGLWPQPLGPKPGLGRLLARRTLPALDLLAATASGRRLLLGGTTAKPAKVPPREAAHLVRAYATAPGFDQVNGAMRAGTFTALEEVRCPLTLIWPQYDRLVSRPRRLPAHAASIELAGCGHIPMWDDPDEVTRLLLAGAST